MADGDKKIPIDISHDINQFEKDKLKHADVKEKNPLPSKEVVEQEKKEINFRKSIEGFPKGALSKTSTEEKNPLPDKNTIEAEKQHEGFKKGIEEFKKEGLSHAETKEPALPDKKAIEDEKEITKTIDTADKVIQNVEGFDRKSLKHTETQEKNPLPNKETIETERRLSATES